VTKTGARTAQERSIEAGLQIEFFHEHSSCPWQMFPFCEPDGRGVWHIKGDLIPLIFSLKARRP
jgi:hypothetical protein